MGGCEDFLPGKLEPSVRDHSGKARILMVILESGHLTVSDGQFFWGGNLNKMGRTFSDEGRRTWLYAGTSVLTLEVGYLLHIYIRYQNHNRELKSLAYL